MSGPRSDYGRALDLLVERLAAYGGIEMPPRLRATCLFTEVASTPLVWPLDDVLFEMLLETAGFDLTDAEDLHGALWALALLVAGDPTYPVEGGLFCGHSGDDESHLCRLIDDVDLDEQYCEVMDLASEGHFDGLAEVRAERCAELGITDQGPGQLPEAA